MPKCYNDQMGYLLIALIPLTLYGLCGAFFLVGANNAIDQALSDGEVQAARLPGRCFLAVTLAVAKQSIILAVILGLGFGLGFSTPGEYHFGLVVAVVVNSVLFAGLSGLFLGVWAGFAAMVGQMLRGPDEMGDGLAKKAALSALVAALVFPIIAIAVLTAVKP